LLSIAATLVVLIGDTISVGVAQGRVDTATQLASAPAQVSETTDSKVTGGGTVVVDVTTIASFGQNAKRPAGYTNGMAVGRINFNKHAPGTDRHVNVAVTLMESENSGTPSPNGTGGKAWIAGNCAGGECPAGITSVIVYTEDKSDSGAYQDIFRISYCFVTAFLPAPNADPTMAPAGCAGPDGGALRTGNVQIRPGGGSGGSGQAPTAARAPIRLP
jgi:hypothetical protein